MRRQFKFENLDSFDDGRIAVAWDQQLSRLMHDLLDRPGLADARKLQLQLNMVPVCDDHGNLIDVKANFQLKPTIPTYNSRTNTLERASVDGATQLIFNDMSEDAEQRTLDQDNEAWEG